MHYIAELSTDVGTYELFELHGTGVMEDPFHDGKVLRTLECSQIEAWAIAQSMNFELYGTISKRSSWESPKVAFRKKEGEPAKPELSMERLSKVISEVFPNCKEGEANYIGPLGDSGLFQIGPGITTGLLGWIEFNKALKEGVKKLYENE